MGISDDLRSSFGEHFLDRPSGRTVINNWTTLCVCGHLRRYHAEATGGSYRLAEQRTQIIGGREVLITTVFGGCVGAVKPRGFEEVTTVNVDRESNTMTERTNPTCPCTEFRGLAEVDRPNRYFNQRIPTDRSDPARHPFVIGLKAFRTHLSKRKAATDNPAWVEEELSRRFTWLDGVRVCDLSKCTETDGVWPVYIDAERSELRCAAHR